MSHAHGRFRPVYMLAARSAPTNQFFRLCSGRNGLRAVHCTVPRQEVAKEFNTFPPEIETKADCAVPGSGPGSNSITRNSIEAETASCWTFSSTFTTAQAHSDGPCPAVTCNQSSRRTCFSCSNFCLVSKMSLQCRSAESRASPITENVRPILVFSRLPSAVWGKTWKMVNDSLDGSERILRRSDSAACFRERRSRPR